MNSKSEQIPANPDVDEKLTSRQTHPSASKDVIFNVKAGKRPFQDDATTDTVEDRKIKRIRSTKTVATCDRPDGTSSTFVAPASPGLVANVQRPNGASMSDFPEMVSSAASASTAPAVTDVDAWYEKHAREGPGPSKAVRLSSKLEGKRVSRILVQGKIPRFKGSQENPIDVDESDPALAPSAWKKILDYPHVKRHGSSKKGANSARSKTTQGRDFWFGPRMKGKNPPRNSNFVLEEVSDSEGKMYLASELGLIGGDGNLDLSLGKDLTQRARPDPLKRDGQQSGLELRLTSPSSGETIAHEPLSTTEDRKEEIKLRGLEPRKAVRSSRESRGG